MKSVSECFCSGINGPGLVPVVLGVLMGFLALLMSWSG